MNLVESYSISCPYCGEDIEVMIDLSAGDQQYIEDCSVCCKPMNLVITVGDDDVPQITVHSDDE